MESCSPIIPSQLSLVTHIVVDEVHERSEDSDFLLMILRGVLRKRKDLRVILGRGKFNSISLWKHFLRLPNV